MRPSGQASNSSAGGESGARIFCISDFRDRRGDLIRRHGRGTGKRKQELQQGRQLRLTFPQQIDTWWMYEAIAGSSEELGRVLANVQKVAPADCVLLSGERGIGNELVARAIHKLSHRSPRAFFRVNCATISPPLIASELFGQQESSPSPGTQPRPRCSELAEGGTIFLDEIGELSKEAQQALLQILHLTASSGDPEPCSDFRGPMGKI